MKVLAILWLLGNYEVTGQGSGIQLKISQHGLNEVVSYLLNNELTSSLQENQTLGDYGFKYGQTQLNVTKLQLHELTGLTGNVSVLDGNKIGINIGISRLALRGNITLRTGGNSENAPNTYVNFLACRLDMLFKFGHVEDKYGLKLETCMDSVGDFKASGVFKHLLEGLYQLSGREMISSIMKKVCTFLRRLTNYRLNDIFIIKDTISFSSSTLGDLSVRMIPRSLSTESVFIVIAVEVSARNEILLGDLSFPRVPFKQTASDVILGINDELLSTLSQLAIQNTTFNEFIVEKSINGTTYHIQANQTSVQGQVRSSEDGSCMIWKSAIDVRSEGDSCIQFKISMDGVIPFVFNYSDATVLASVDRDRLQMKYEVSSSELTCPRPEANTDMQKNILQVIHNEFETLLAGKTLSLIFPKDKWYGFKDAKLKPTNGGLLVFCGIRVGKQSNERVGRFKSLHHKFYNRKWIKFTFSDGQTMEADKPVITSTPSTTKKITHKINEDQTMKGDSQRTATLPINASSSLFLSKNKYLVICAVVTVCLGIKMN